MSAQTTELVLSLLIEAAVRASQLAVLYKQAKQENRDVTKEELDALRREDDIARRRIQDLIDLADSAPKDLNQFKQPPLEALVVNPVTDETAADQVRAQGESVAEADPALKSDRRIK